MQMSGVWTGLPQQLPQPYNLTVPENCRTTSLAQMACTLSHLFTIFSAHQAGLVSSCSSALALSSLAADLLQTYPAQSCARDAEARV